MSQPAYRERPAAVRLREREHHPACKWCRWSDSISPRQCSEPHLTPDGEARYCKVLNSGGDCTYYAPSLVTRLLQMLNLRPFIERSRAQEGS